MTRTTHTYVLTECFRFKRDLVIHIEVVGSCHYQFILSIPILWKCHGGNRPALQGSGIQQMLNATKGPMTRIKKKRTRLLQLPDPIDNPFCSDRQIEDIYHEMTAKPKLSKI